VLGTSLRRQSSFINSLKKSLISVVDGGLHPEPMALEEGLGERGCLDIVEEVRKKIVANHYAVVVRWSLGM